jgi:hypothetical protein
MAVRVTTGGLKDLSKEQIERVENQLLKSLVRELGHVLPPDWTQVTFSRIGPPHDVAAGERNG